MTRQSIFPGMQDDARPEPTTPVAPAAQDRNAPAAEPAAEPATLVGKTVWVVDANSLIFQVFHAIPEMTSPRGEPVNAVFGFVRDILYLAQNNEPHYLFCAFDMAGL